MKSIKQWTALEVRNLKEWRLQDIPIKTIAKRLNRTYISVKKKLNHIGLRIQPISNQNIKDQIKYYVKRGYCDGLIAVKINRVKYTIRRIRKELGLKANPHQSWKQDIGQSKFRPRCSNCNKLCPIAIQRDWKKLTGWTSQAFNLCGSKATQYRCKECTNQLKY